MLEEPDRRGVRASESLRGNNGAAARNRPRRSSTATTAPGGAGRPGVEVAPPREREELT
jgi:hypothetical protein